MTVEKLKLMLVFSKVCLNCLLNYLQMKDHFSGQAELYSLYRPNYPAELYQFINQSLHSKELAWDVATGNGQIASELSEIFKQVYASDISEKQLEHAIKKDNITYKVEAAEHCSLASKSCDLIIVGQAIHWFDFTAFYEEVKRVLKPGGLIVLVGYGFHTIDSECDPIINHFYRNILDGYWEPERRYIDEAYENVPFPFGEIEKPIVKLELEYTYDQYIGYLNTWSATQKFIRNHRANPIDLIKSKLEVIWPHETKKKVHFPVLMKAGKFYR
jgi:ubiquinone/menaquinone biosynthesis C-methylase UbiE